MFKENKNLNVETFTNLQSQNTKYIGFVVLNSYEIGIDNLDIRFVI